MGEFDFLSAEDDKNTSDAKKNKKVSKKSKNNQTNINLNDIDYSEERELVEINSPEGLEEFLIEYQDKHTYDPCPTIKADHYIWIKLLQFAEKQDKDTYNLLHYLRGQQCKLKIARDNNSHPILKLALEESKYLLEQHMTDDELGIDRSQHEQMKLIQTATDQINNMGKQRQKNIAIGKRKKELEEVARKRILDEIVLPKVKEVKLTFDMMKPLLKKAENDSGVLNFSLKSFNDYLENKERGYV